MTKPLTKWDKITWLTVAFAALVGFLIVLHYWPGDAEGETVEPNEVILDANSISESFNLIGRQKRSVIDCPCGERWIISYDPNAGCIFTCKWCSRIYSSKKSEPNEPNYPDIMALMDDGTRTVYDPLPEEDYKKRLESIEQRLKALEERPYIRLADIPNELGHYLYPIYEESQILVIEEGKKE